MGGNPSKSPDEDKKNGIQGGNDDDGESVFTEAAKNHGSPQGKVEPTNRRTSFYETVDASEVLPYLIIGNSFQAAILSG